MTDWADVPVFGSPPSDVVATMRPSAYAIVADAGGRIAVVRTPRGLYLPGGGMDAVESPANAVVREVREETGLRVSAGAWSVHAVDHVYSADERTHFEKRSTFIDARVDGPPLPAVEADHALEWLAPHAAAAHLTHPGHRWAVGQWLGRSASPSTSPESPVR